MVSRACSPLFARVVVKLSSTVLTDGVALSPRAPRPCAARLLIKACTQRTSVTRRGPRCRIPSRARSRPRWPSRLPGPRATPRWLWSSPSALPPEVRDPHPRARAVLVLPGGAPEAHVGHVLAQDVRLVRCAFHPHLED